MAYLLTADEYFNQYNTLESDAKLIDYLQKIPTKFWESLDSFDPTRLSNITKTRLKYSEDDRIWYQLKLINSPNVFETIKADDLLERLGYNPIQLHKLGQYDSALIDLNEGITQTLWSFVVGSDTDPLEQALDILRVIADIVGFIPNPISAAGNIISGIVSWYKGDYFSAALSILMTVPITAPLGAVGKTLGNSASKLISKFFSFSSKPDVAKTEAVILREGLTKIGGATLVDSVKGIFKGFASIIGSTITGIIRFVLGAIEGVLSKIPLIGKYTPKFTMALDKMLLNFNKIGKSLDTATKILEEGVAGTGKAAGSAIIKTKGAAKTASYLKDLELEITKSSEYAKILKASNGDKNIINGYLKAKKEMELVGGAHAGLESALKTAASATGKDAATILAKLDGKSLTSFVKNKTTSEISTLFKDIVHNPEIANSLSTGEKRLFGVFTNNPSAFKEGLTKFPEVESYLGKLLKSTDRWVVERGSTLKHILALSFKLAWTRYGSINCIEKGISKAGDITKSIANEIKPTSEEINSIFEDDETPITAAEVENGTIEIPKASLDDLKQRDPESYQIMMSTINAANAAKAPASTTTSTPTSNTEVAKHDTPVDKKKRDCSTQAALINSVIGNQYSAVLTGMNKNTEYNKDSDKGTTQYTKGVLKKLNLPSDINVVHELSKTADPVTMAFTSDIIDHTTGEISLNMSKESRIDATLSQMVSDGIIKQEQVDGIKKEVEDHLKNGTIPDGLAQLVAQEIEPANEGFLKKIKGFAHLNK